MFPPAQPLRVSRNRSSFGRSANEVVCRHKSICGLYKNFEFFISVEGAAKAIVIEFQDGLPFEVCVPTVETAASSESYLLVDISLPRD